MTAPARTPSPDGRRLLLVHAHPDDEAIATGATMAKYAAEGAAVTLVTCTLGELGEVIPPDLAYLAADKDGGLGEYRIGELAAACAELGVTDHRFLGGAGRWRDSGMMGEPTNDDPRCFWRADVEEAAAALLDVVRDVRPQVIVSYDANGFYGHPDHIQAHRVATYAASLAAVPTYRTDLGEAWDIAKIYWGAMSESRMREGLRALRAAGDTTSFEGMDPDGPLPFFAIKDDDLSAAIDAQDYVDRKMDALRAHATQITTDGPFFALSNNVGSEAWGVEFYRLVKGRQGPVGDGGLETDLFAGVG
jgi:N-acetyl-1-D-myo-inositol-2-amino-2-deoxy-alpha-D-glucopyranoside deacetylase